MAGTDDLSERVQRLEDLHAITRLCNDYGRYLDQGDLESFVALFTEDAEYRIGPMAQGTGHDEIREAMRPVLARTQGSAVHVIGHPHVELDGDTARCEVMWTVVVPDGSGQARVSMTGRHVDQLVRQDGTWRFQRRIGLAGIPSEMPATD